MRAVVTAAALVLSAPAHSAVLQANGAGFVIENKAVVRGSPDAVYRLLGEPRRHWSGQHSYSGDAAKLSLELRAGACFCERVPADGGTIEHMRVVQARPGTLLRMTGGLGPLQREGVSGSLSWSLRAVEDGTEVTQTYVVGGLIRAGAERLAPAVDGVLAQQLGGLQAAAAR